MPRNALSARELDSMRERLCRAALELFRDGGLDAVTFRSLAEAGGVSHTLPYRYFENKEALLANVRLMCFEQFESRLRARESTGTGVLGRVIAVLDAYVDFAFDHPAEYTLIFSTGQPPPQRHPELLAARRRLFEHSVDLVQLCIDADLVSGDARAITHAVWCGLHGLLTLHVANQLVHGCSLQDLVKPMIARILGMRAQDFSAAVAPASNDAMGSRRPGRRIARVATRSTRQQGKLHE